MFATVAPDEVAATLNGALKGLSRILIPLGGRLPNPELDPGEDLVQFRLDPSPSPTITVGAELHGVPLAASAHGRAANTTTPASA